MEILYLTLKRKWFYQILNGIKLEEYREIKPYWIRRLNKKHTHIIFKNGYSKDVPEFCIELKEILEKVITWESGVTEKVFAIQLGQILWQKNIKNDI